MQQSCKTLTTNRSLEVSNPSQVLKSGNPIRLNLQSPKSIEFFVPVRSPSDEQLFAISN
jgi:hypothetical protein